jgi:hypothetical protein
VPSIVQYSVSDNTWWYQYFQGASYSADLASADVSVCYVTLAYSGGYVAVNVTQLPGGATSVSASTNYGLFAKSTGGSDGYGAIQGGAQTALSGAYNWTWLNAAHTPLTVAGANGSLQETLWMGTSGGGNVAMCDMVYRDTAYEEGGGTSFVSWLYAVGPMLVGAHLLTADFDRIIREKQYVGRNGSYIQYAPHERAQLIADYKSYRFPRIVDLGRRG